MTNAEMAILTLLGEAPRHGYEMEQIIEQRGMREWTEIGFSSIYYVLNRLETQGLIESVRSSSAGQGPGKKVFSLTEKGRVTLREQSLAFLSRPPKDYRPLDLGLANLPGLDRAEAAGALRTHREEMKSWIAHVEARAGLPFNQVEHVQMMFDLALVHYRAEIDWLDRSIARLERGTPNE